MMPTPIEKTLCRRVRSHLALLAGSGDGDVRDVSSGDLRAVERHLLVCPACRLERESLDRAAAVLRTAATAAVVSEAAPSIWPALERQIRRSRHERPVRWFGLATGPALGLAASLLVVGALVGLVGGQLGLNWTYRVALEPGGEPSSRPALPGPSAASGPTKLLRAETQLSLDADPKPATSANPRDPQRSQ